MNFQNFKENEFISIKRITCDFCEKKFKRITEISTNHLEICICDQCAAENFEKLSMLYNEQLKNNINVHFHQVFWFTGDLIKEIGEYR